MAVTLLAILLGFTLITYHQAVQYLAGLWNQLLVGDYAHGYLVLGISCYLIFSNRNKLFKSQPCPNPWALSGIAAASLLWVFSTLVDIQAAQSVSLLLMLAMVTWYILGSRLMRKLLFPVLFISFALPIWFPLSPVLQEITADAVFWLIRAANVPAFREQHVISVPAGHLSIEEACSGLRYLLAALTLGSFYAYINYSTLRARVAIVLISIIAAIFTNIVRVYIVVYLAYKTDMQHPMVEDHLSLGWYLFGAVVFFLLVLDAVLYKRRLKKSRTSTVEAREKIPVSATCKGENGYPIYTLLAFALIAAGPAAVWWVNNQPASNNGEITLELPAGIAGWRGPFPATDDWSPIFNGAVTDKRIYNKDIDTVVVYFGYYPEQRQGSELINELNQIGGGDKWRNVYAQGRVRIKSNQKFIEQLIENNGEERLLIWYWYIVNGQPVTNQYQAKLLQVLGIITRHPQAAVLAIATPMGEDTDPAKEKLEDFLITMQGQLNNIESIVSVQQTSQ